MNKKHFLILGVLPSLVIQLVGTWLYFVALADTPWAIPVYAATKALMLAWPLLWLLLHAPIPRFSLAPNRASAIWGLVSWVVIAATILFAGQLFFPTLVFHADDILTRIDDFIHPSSFILLAVVYSTVHALFEEYFWRWFVLRGLLTAVSPMNAILIGSLAFTSHHVILLLQFFPTWLAIIGSVGVFAGGVFWSWLALRQKGLVGPWISHIFADAAIFVIGYILLF